MFSKMMAALGDLRIGTRLTGGFVFLALLCAVVGLCGLRTASQMNDQLENVTGKLIPSVQALASVRARVLTLFRTERTLIIAKRGKNEALFQSVSSLQDATWKSLGPAVKKYESIPMKDREKEIWVKIQSCLDTYRKDHDATMAAIRANELAQAEKLCEAAMPNAYAMCDRLAELIELQEDEAVQEAALARNTYSWARVSLLSVTGVAILLAISG